jgi:hypothetical protein
LILLATTKIMKHYRKTLFDNQQVGKVFITQ